MKLPGLVLAALVICIFLICNLSYGKSSVSFLDVGQGDAIYIRTADNYSVLIDGGPSASILEKVAEMMPMHSKEIDLVVLTHPHSDHVNGLVEIVRRFRVNYVLIVGTPYYNAYYHEFLKLCDERNVKIIYASADNDIKIGSHLYLDILWPRKSMKDIEFKNVNNASIILKAHVAGIGSFLLSGDAEIEQESEVLNYGFNLYADVLKAGHHGSKTASSDEFLKEVGAKTVVIQSGVDNSFGHPHKETLEKLFTKKYTIKRNDLEGRIDFISLQYQPPAFLTSAQASRNHGQ